MNDTALRINAFELFQTMFPINHLRPCDFQRNEHSGPFVHVSYVERFKRQMYEDLFSYHISRNKRRRLGRHHGNQIYTKAVAVPASIHGHVCKYPGLVLAWENEDTIKVIQRWPLRHIGYAMISGIIQYEFLQQHDLILPLTPPAH